MFKSKIYTPDDLLPRGPVLDWRQIEQAYRVNAFNAWQKSDEATKLKCASLPYSVLAGENMDTPDREVFLYRYLFAALRKKHGTSYKWRPQYQKYGTCFPADSLVTMADGTEKPIENVKVGDWVITHNGNKRQVLETGVRKYTGDLYSFEINGTADKVRMTAEHPICSIKDGEVTWIEAKDFTLSDYCLLPKYETNSDVTLDLANYVECTSINENYIRSANNSKWVNRYIKIDKNFARLMGLYLAEGHADKYQVGFSLNITETYIQDEITNLVYSIFGLKTNFTEDIEHNKRRVIISNKSVAQFFRKFCPGKALTKRIPEVFFSQSNEIKLALIRAWIDGDGNITYRRNTIRVAGYTASKMLTHDITRIIVSLGFKPNICTRAQQSHQNSDSYIIGFCGNDALELQNETYKHVTTITKCQKPRTYIKHELGLLVKAKNITKIYVKNLDVYNLEVDVEHSYIVNSIGVHNCVGMGHKLGVDTVMAVNSLILDHKFLGRAAVAPIYAGGRVDIAGQPGNWDGSNGYWTTPWLTKYGVVLLAEMDLPEDSRDEDENIAVSWASKREGVPVKYEDIAKVKPIKEAPKITNTKEAAKALQAGHPITICTNLIPTGQRNSQGFSPVRNSGGHCTLIWAYRKDPVGFLYQNSWSENWGSGGIYPSDQPDGSVWITERELQMILDADDSFALVGMTGLEPLDTDVVLAV